MMASLLIGLTCMKNSPADQPIQVQAKAAPKAFKGILLAASGLLFFACMDTTTKYLTAHFNVPFVVAMRYLVHCAIMLIILAPRSPEKLIKTQRTSLVIVRAAMLTTASLFIGLALQRMPLAEATAINFLAPTLVALFATFVLGEEIGGLGWIAVVAGFGGVLLIARPSSGLDVYGVMFALLAACAGAAYQLLSRVLSSTEKAVTMLFYTALVGSIVFGIALPWFWENKVPSYLELALFFSMGLAGGLGHFLFTLSFRYAPASVLAPITYLQLLWAGLLGWLIFDSTPDGLSVLGMVIIASAGLLIALKSRFGKPASTKTY
jgi:drug/metabolite transporter (DMT)-like permease